MIIKNITNVKDFFEAVDKCEGKVELVTSQGDRLNLKSKLTQYISLTNMFTEAKIGDVELLVSEPEDVKLLIDFMVRG